MSARAERHERSASLNRSRGLLAALWYGSFLLSVTVVLLVWARQDTLADKAVPALRALSGAYAPYLVALGLFYWKGPDGPQSHHREHAAARLRLAIAASLIWNGVVLFFLIPLPFQVGSIDDAIEAISLVGSTFSWLVAGAIGYYFVAPSKSA
jgi:hypothetical protein